MERFEIWRKPDPGHPRRETVAWGLTRAQAVEQLAMIARRYTVRSDAPWSPEWNQDRTGFVVAGPHSDGEQYGIAIDGGIASHGPARYSPVAEIAEQEARVRAQLVAHLKVWHQRSTHPFEDPSQTHRAVGHGDHAASWLGTER